MHDALVRYDNLQILNLSLSGTIRSGEMVGVLGKNGTGKTTLAKILSGELRNFQGVVHSNIQASHIAFSDFTADHLGFHYSDFYYQQRYHASDPSIALTLREYLGKCSLMEWVEQVFDSYTLSKRLIELSSGETRKALILKNLLQDVPLHILDSPFTGLDAESIGRFIDIFIEMVNSRGKAMILLLQDNRWGIPLDKIISLDENKLKDLDKSFLLDSMSNLFSRTSDVDFEIVFQVRNADIRAGGKTLIHAVNWQIKRGQKWVLKGPNGSGKSTLMSLLNADNPMAYGMDMLLFDRPKGSGETIWDIKSKIGFVSPEIQLFWNSSHTIQQIVSSGFTDTLYLNRQLTPSEKHMFDHIIQMFGWSGQLDRTFGTLSSGEKKLVMVARTLVKNPPVLILDEVFQGIDEVNFHFLYHILENLADANRTIVQITHDEREILPCIQFHARIHDGRLEVINAKES